MKKIVQQCLLPRWSIIKTLAFIVVLMSATQSCSKSDRIADPGKPLQVARNFLFEMTPANQFGEEESKSISLKLRLSISAVQPGINTKQVLWDTLIARTNLYEFTHEARETINTTLTGPVNSFQHLLFEYVIIYNHHGALVTRSQSEGANGDRLTVKL